MTKKQNDSTLTTAIPNNISFPANFDYSNVNNSKTKTTKMEKVKTSGATISCNEAIGMCESLIKTINILYSTKQHKELYDSLVSLEEVKKILNDLNKN